MKKFIRFALATLTALAWVAQLATAQTTGLFTPKTPTINLPQDLKTDVGVPLTLTVTTNGKLVKFVPILKLTQDGHPCHYLLPAGDNSYWFVASAPGDYQIGAYTALADVPSDVAYTTIKVGGGAPTPPDPPNPPSNPYTLMLAPFYDASKADVKAKISAAHRAVGVKWCKSNDVRTAGDLSKQLHSEIQLAGVGTTDLIQLRQKVASIEAEKLPPTPGTVLDDKMRQDAASIFTAIADALDLLK